MESASRAMTCLDDIHKHTKLDKLNSLEIGTKTKEGISYFQFQDAKLVVDYNQMKQITNPDEYVKRIENALRNRSLTPKQKQILQNSKRTMMKISDSVKSGARNYYKEHSMFAFEDPIEAGIRHEFGHHFHASNVDEIEKFLMRKAPRAKDDLDNFLWFDNKGAKKWGLTNRGKTDLGECIAENFALYSVGKTKGMHEDMIELFKRFTTWRWE